MSFLVRILTWYLLKKNKLELSITDRLNILRSVQLLGKTFHELHLSFWHPYVYKYFVRVLGFVGSNMFYLEIQREMLERR